MRKGLLLPFRLARCALCVSGDVSRLTHEDCTMSFHRLGNEEDESDAYNMHLQLEDSQSHIANLLEMLAFENYAEESSQASHIINGMEAIIGKFSENHYDIQMEMNSMLESSRRGLLTHGQLSELVAAEATRSQHLAGILDSLKDQIENMYEALADGKVYDHEAEEVVHQEFTKSSNNFAQKVELLMKSVNSMERVVVAPAKKIASAVATIDSEVVMHVNKTKLEQKELITPKKLASLVGQAGKQSRASGVASGNNRSASIAQSTSSAALNTAAGGATTATAAVAVAAAPKEMVSIGVGDMSIHEGAKPPPGFSEGRFGVKNAFAQTTISGSAGVETGPAVPAPVNTAATAAATASNQALSPKISPTAAAVSTSSDKDRTTAVAPAIAAAQAPSPANVSAFEHHEHGEDEGHEHDDDDGSVHEGHADGAHADGAHPHHKKTKKGGAKKKGTPVAKAGGAHGHAADGDHHAARKTAGHAADGDHHDTVSGDAGHHKSSAKHHGKGSPDGDHHESASGDSGHHKSSAKHHGKGFPVPPHINTTGDHAGIPRPKPLVLNPQSRAELEAEIYSTMEAEIKRRVKQALAAAATRDFDSFSSALSAKSPGSRASLLVLMNSNRPQSREAVAEGASVAPATESSVPVVSTDAPHAPTHVPAESGAVRQEGIASSASESGGLSPKAVASTPAGSALRKSLSARGKNVTIAENEVSSVISLPTEEHSRPAAGSSVPFAGPSTVSPKLAPPPGSVPAGQVDAHHVAGHPPQHPVPAPGAQTAPSPSAAQQHPVQHPAQHAVQHPAQHQHPMMTAGYNAHPHFQTGEHVPAHAAQSAPGAAPHPPGQAPHPYPQAAPGQGMTPPNMVYVQVPGGEGQYIPAQQMQMPPGQQMYYAPAQGAPPMNPAAPGAEGAASNPSVPPDAAYGIAVPGQVPPQYGVPGGPGPYVQGQGYMITPNAQYPHGSPQGPSQDMTLGPYIPPEAQQWMPGDPPYVLGQHMQYYQMAPGADHSAPHGHPGVNVPALDLHPHPQYHQHPHYPASPQHHHPQQSNQGEVYYPQTNPITGSPILMPTVTQPWVPPPQYGPNGELLQGSYAPSGYYPGTSQGGSSYYPGAPYGHVSQSLHLGSVEAGASVLTDNVREIVGIPSEMPSIVGAPPGQKAPRAGGNQASTQASIDERAFRELAAAEMKADQERRLNMTKTGEIAIAAPSRVDMFNQIFQSTPDPKKIEMIRIQAPEVSSKRIHRGTNTTTHEIAVGPAAPMTDIIVSGRSVESQQPPPEISSLMNLSGSDILSSRVPPGHPPSNHNSRPPTAPSPLKKPMRQMKEAEVQAIRDALSKALDADACSYLLSEMQHVLTGTGGASESRKMGATIVASGGAELPIYDNQAGILLTRTYRTQTPPATFIEILSSSDNPLLYLYEEYAPFLSKMQCTRLLNAAVIEDRVKNDLPTSKSAQVLLGKLLESMMSTVAECAEVMKMLRECEERVHAMVELLRRKPDSLQAIVSSVQMKELFIVVGDIEATKVTVDLKLVEFRAFIERINAQGSHELDQLMRESTDFEYCYKHFLACQGKSVEMSQRLEMLRDRCIRHNLGFGKDKKKKKKPKIEFDDQTSVGMNGPEAHAQEVAELRNEIEDLKEQLAEAKEEFEDNEVEMLEVMTERDKSPDALLFFAIMHDPSYMQNLQQLVLQIKHLRGFSDGTGHMDFITLRKRLQVCCVLTPSLEKLVERYHMMYQKWSNFRLNWFSARKLNGGSADAFNSCPLCFQCVSPDGDGTTGSSKGSPKKSAAALAVTGMDQRNLKKQTRQLKMESQHKELRVSRSQNLNSADDVSTISSPDKPKMRLTLPNIK